MPMKSKEWFYKHCLREIDTFSPYAHLCWDVLQKGIGQQDATRGHVTQAIGATQGFLAKYPNWKGALRKADPTKPFDIAANAKMLLAWKSWIGGKKGKYERKAFGYSYTTLKHYLTPSLGGTCSGGGGGNDEFKKVLRLIVVFLNRK
jgi:hypothetical protein